MKVFSIIRKILISPLLLIIRVYQLVISPFFHSSCRHNPTCSSYSIEAFRKHGLIKGLILSAWRILRCNPWGTYGDDPVPEKFNLNYFKKNLIKNKA